MCGIIGIFSDKAFSRIRTALAVLENRGKDCFGLASEKEIKYAAKIPAAILLTGRLINRIFKSEKFDKFNEVFFNKLTIWIFQLSHFTRLDKLFLKLFPVGVRSYIVMQKGKE